MRAQSPAELRVLSSETDILDPGCLCVLSTWAGRLVEVKGPRGRRSGPVASSQDAEAIQSGFGVLTSYRR